MATAFAESSRIVVESSRLTQLALDATALAGRAATKGMVDTAVMVDLTDESRMNPGAVIIVTARDPDGGAPHHVSFRGDGDRSTYSVLDEQYSSEEPNVHKTWLEQNEDGSLHKVTAARPAGSLERFSGHTSVPVDPENVLYMFQNAADLAQPRTQQPLPLTPADLGPKPDTLSVRTERVVPILAKVLDITGDILRSCPSETKSAAATIRANFTASGELQDASQTISFKLSNKKVGRVASFYLTAYCDPNAGHFALVGCGLNTEQESKERTAGTQDTLARDGDDLYLRRINYSLPPRQSHATAMTRGDKVGSGIIFQLAREAAVFTT